ncbi:endo alpha-1,4 polygalactosaminidase [Georgenia sp. TF02-10]|uniref:endo alpha-1,4 polygalactosaminidase n=1 Tax=Georgenia sp. TF02-10 TaxID=2917725 RepID=UPI0021123808|nr:endo alpha-1,4 polygalactosaminidase [Georgenia sp. TF02-10]
MADVEAGICVVDRTPPRPPTSPYCTGAARGSCATSRWVRGSPGARTRPTCAGGRRAILTGWPDERWLDVSRLDVLIPSEAERLRRRAAAGFDGVELDNTDAYAFH